MPIKRIRADKLTNGTEVLALVRHGVTFSGKVQDFTPGARNVFFRLGEFIHTFEVPNSYEVEVSIPDLVATFDSFRLGQVFSSSGNGSVKYIKVGKRAFVAETGTASRREEVTIYGVNELTSEGLVFTPIG